MNLSLPIRFLFLTLLTTPGLALAELKLLSAECEQALALSALPERLRSEASVFVLGADGFHRTVKSSGPFTCIVERNHPQSLIPQCVDAAGASTIIPGIIKKTNWALQGVPAAERTARFNELVEQGAIGPPPRPGLSYMISDYNYAWVERRGEFFKIPPHVMFYAPNLTNDDIGGSMSEGMNENRGMPFIIEPGAHAYMTSFVEHTSDSEQVREHCAGQVPESLPQADNKTASNDNP